MRIVTRETNFHQGIGLPPGEVVAVDGADTPQTRIRLMAYSKDSYLEKSGGSIDEMLSEVGKWTVCWIHIQGLGDAHQITDLCARLKVHPLAVEDMLNTDCRPKLDEFDNDLFMTTRAAVFKESEEAVYMEQITFYASEGLLVSIQESNERLFDPVLKRIHNKQARIRQRGVSYLAFALMDVKNDFIMSILDEIEDDIVALEQEMLEKTGHGRSRHSVGVGIEEIYRKKRAVLALMRILLPMRDNANRLEYLDHPLLDEADRFFFRDLADSARRAVERMEHNRIILQTMQEFSHLEQEHRTNEVMKVLTIIATLFLPLTFIAGVYGMNFSHEASPWNMPELYWKYGYFMCLGLMAFVFIAFLVFFRRRDWL
ncbi:MAG: magnesium/cobalt transporter CorA [Verrucomicrobiota bacterium]